MKTLISGVILLIVCAGLLFPTNTKVVVRGRPTPTSIPSILPTPKVLDRIEVSEYRLFIPILRK